MEPIIRILVEDILTFAYCDGDQIDEDFSVAQLERIAQALKAAGGPSTDSFLAVVASMADESRSAGNEDRAGQLDAMPLHLGLA
jgi:hypothetical protein